MMDTAQLPDSITFRGLRVFQNEILDALLGGFGYGSFLFPQNPQQLSGFFIGLEIIYTWAAGFYMLVNLGMLIWVEVTFQIVKQKFEA